MKIKNKKTKKEINVSQGRWEYIKARSKDWVVADDVKKPEIKEVPVPKNNKLELEDFSKTIKGEE